MSTDGDLLAQAKDELLELQDAIDWPHVLPRFRNSAARWAKNVRSAKNPSDVFKGATELADMRAEVAGVRADMEAGFARLTATLDSLAVLIKEGEERPSGAGGIFGGRFAA